jgi:GR25 family glycosyltransferase involved in LPS biosynthesis
MVMIIFLFMAEHKLKNTFDVYSIVVKDNLISESGYSDLVNSSNIVNNNFEIKRYQAITPDDNEYVMKHLDIKWNYPIEGNPVFDENLGLIKSPYKASNHAAKISCALSHYLLWMKCYYDDKPILILEHDAYFINRFTPNFILRQDRYQIVGINSPIGATRKANLYNKIITEDISGKSIIPVPRIDSDKRIIQGLAGGSAYFIKPDGIKKVIDFVKNHGLMHNDCILCYQLFDDILGVTKTFYTKVNRPNLSTTRK